MKLAFESDINKSWNPSDFGFVKKLPESYLSSNSNSVTSLWFSDQFYSGLLCVVMCSRLCHLRNKALKVLRPMMLPAILCIMLTVLYLLLRTSYSAQMLIRMAAVLGAYCRQLAASYLTLCTGDCDMLVNLWHASELLHGNTGSLYLSVTPSFTLKFCTKQPV